MNAKNCISNKTANNSKLNLFSKKKLNTSCKSNKLKKRSKLYFKYDKKINSNFKNSPKKNTNKKRNSEELSNLVSLNSLDRNNDNNSINDYNQKNNLIKVNMIKTNCQSVEKNDYIKPDEIIYRTENLSEFFKIMSSKNKTYMNKKISMTNLKCKPNKNNIIVYKPEKTSSQKNSFKAFRIFSSKLNDKNNEIKNKTEYKDQFENIQIRVINLLGLYSKIVSKNLNEDINLYNSDKIVGGKD